MAARGVIFIGLFIIGLVLEYGVVEGLGVNWGTMASHKLKADTVVQMLKDNGIQKVKLFDAESTTMKALVNTGIEVMIAIPNDQLASMNEYDRAKEWVKENVTNYYFHGGVNITYVAVGNEPFLKSYNNSFLNITFPAVKNIQNALNEAKHGDSIKVTVPLNADVYNSPENNPVPSAGRFRTDIRTLMKDIVGFLNDNGAPFTVNIYPFLSLYGNDDFPLDYAFFDGGRQISDGLLGYTNVFDANFDTLVSSLKDVGYGDMPVLVGEVGWPTDGDKNANAAMAERFYKKLLARLVNGAGTPLRAGPIEVYLFGLLDENGKSIAPGPFERHWGIFRYDGQPKYPMDLSGQENDVYLLGAKDVKYKDSTWCTLNPDADKSKLVENVDYACTFSDCTALGYGSSCNGMDENANASYAFNMYFQEQNQDPLSCNFQGLATTTTTNISQGSCNFTIQIDTGGAGRSQLVLLLAVALAAMDAFFFLH